jgi:hypothetical protein
VLHCDAPCCIVRAVRRVNLRPRRRRPSPCRRRRASPRRSPLQCGAATRRQQQRNAEATENNTSWHHATLHQATLHQATLHQATLQQATIATCDDCNVRRLQHATIATCDATAARAHVRRYHCKSPSRRGRARATRRAANKHTWQSPPRGVQAWAGRGGQSPGADGGEPQNCSALSLRAETEASPALLRDRR